MLLELLAQAENGLLERDALMLIWAFCALVHSGAFQLSSFSLFYSSLAQLFLFFPKNLKLTPNLGVKCSYSNKDNKICKRV